MSVGDEERLRPATAADAGAIRSLIFRVGINPRGLDWRRFLVAVAPGGRLVGRGEGQAEGRWSARIAFSRRPPQGARARSALPNHSSLDERGRPAAVANVP